jgi:hypothetical protein
MSDWETAVSLLLSPVSLVIITVVASGVADYFIRKHFRQIDKKQEHSIKLKDGAFIPWTKLSMGHLGWGMRDAREFPRYYELALYPNPGDLLTTPVFQWAARHLEVSYPKLWSAWRNFLVGLEKEASAVAHARGTIRASLEKEFRERFSGRLGIVAEWHPGKVEDVLFVDRSVAVVFNETIEVLG